MNRLINIPITAFDWLASFFVFVMMMLTFVDVVGRYLFNSPVFGAAEIIQFLMAFTIFSGLVLVNAKDKHITVELFENQIKYLIGVKLHHFIVQSFSVITMAVVAFVLSEYAMETYEKNSVTIVLEWPLVIVCSAIAAFSIISLIVMSIALFKPRPRITEFYKADPE